MTRTRRQSTKPSRSECIDVELCLNSGQVFLWEKCGDSWNIINGSEMIVVGSRVPHRGPPAGFFRLDDDIDAILAEIGKDERVRQGIARNPGLGILRQDPFQCMISFIVSANSNIPRIRSSLFALCRRFGRKASRHGRELSLFPEPEALAGARVGELEECGLGYRARYVRDAAALVDGGCIDLEGLRGAGYDDVREELLRVPGVGSKVADCIMLFSLDRLDAFPLDRWMIRILREHYGFADIGSLTPRRYGELHRDIVGRFGRYAGYAQQYLFRMEREEHRMSW